MLFTIRGRLDQLWKRSLCRRVPIEKARCALPFTPGFFIMAADKSKGQALQHWIAMHVPRLHRKRGHLEKASLTGNVRFQGGLLGGQALTFSDIAHTISGVTAGSGGHRPCCGRPWRGNAADRCGTKRGARLRIERRWKLARNRPNARQ